MKRVGPELKMPKLKGGEMKVPPFLSDLYADLRDRRLLPLVALILVAIVATPFLLGGGSEELEPVPSPSAVASGSSDPAGQELTVVKAAPGLRNYKKRLAHRSPTNPFKQRYTGPQGLAQAKLGALPSGSESSSESGSGESTGGGSGAEAPSEPSPVGGSGGSTVGKPEGESKNGVPDGATFFTLEVTLQITRIETKPDGSVDKKGPTTYKDVRAPAPLPGEKTPVITYLGMGSKGHVPMFLVSNEVTAIYGEANCIAGGGTCQLLVLEEGFPVTFVYGDNDVRYKVNLVKAEPVVTDRT
ncbi:MAG TPA: hypothetical protein VFJ61_08960 [Solirubrobacterales bacterium]|nr:hypothetical protein [Solirubrobacterales bacterium]